MSGGKTARYLCDLCARRHMKRWDYRYGYYRTTDLDSPASVGTRATPVIHDGEDPKEICSGFRQRRVGANDTSLSF